MRNSQFAIRNSQSGFTLAECLLACVLLVGITLAVGQALVAGQKQTQEAITVERAMDLAGEMMQRIASLPYNEPQGGQHLGPESGETTPQLYDNMDDFNGYVEKPGHIKNALGALFPSDYQSFTRSVATQYGDANAGSLGSVHGLTVTVTVTDGKETWTLTRFMPEGL